MAKDRSLVRASDIGSWTFCNRAWWLANVANAEHEHPEALQAGTRLHGAHGRALRRADRLQSVGLLFLAVGLIGVGLILLAWVWIG